MAAAIALPSLTTVSYSDLWRWCAGETGLRTPNGLSQSHLGQKFWSFCALVSLNLLFAFFSSAHLMFQAASLERKWTKSPSFTFYLVKHVCKLTCGLVSRKHKATKVWTSLNWGRIHFASCERTNNFFLTTALFYSYEKVASNFFK